MQATAALHNKRSFHGGGDAARCPLRAATEGPPGVFMMVKGVGQLDYKLRIIETVCEDH